MSEWKPIETAPMNGKPIELGWWEVSAFNGKLIWRSTDGYWVKTLFFGKWKTNQPGRPTYWRLFPDPPNDL